MSTIAPGRIDLAGGTLDVPPLCFLIENALTLNIAINLTTQVQLVPSESWRLFIDGSLVQEAPLPVLFEKTQRYLKVARPFDIHTTSLIPRSSGLGGSSVLLVALVRALLATEVVSPPEGSLLELVTVLEHQILGKPAGTQDAIAAIEGGVSRIDYLTGKPRRKQIKPPAFLQGSLFLAYSPVQHHSGMNNWAIIKAACEGDAQTLEKLQALSDNAHQMLAALEASSKPDFEACLRREAVIRNGLAAGMMTPDLQAFADQLPSAAIAKICGAGGGGCMLLFGDLPPKSQMEALAKTQGLTIFEVALMTQGCRSLQG